jgi:hypothetical protein
MIVRYVVSLLPEGSVLAENTKWLLDIMFGAWRAKPTEAKKEWFCNEQAARNAYVRHKRKAELKTGPPVIFGHPLSARWRSPH